MNVGSQRFESDCKALNEFYDCAPWNSENVLLLSITVLSLVTTRGHC